MSKYLAKEIWEKGWFQAFLDNEDKIPKNMRKDWDEMQAIADKIQIKVDKLLEKYPWSVFE